MDEKAVLAEAADELTREGDIEEVEITLRRQKTESFPVILFTVNVVNDVIVDPAMSFINLTGVSWFFYMGLVWVPLFLWNMSYFWGKMSGLRRLLLKKGLRTAGGAAASVVKNFQRKIVTRAGLAQIAGAVPFVSILVPQSLFILLAHNRHNKIVSQLLEAIEVVGRAGSNPMALRRASYQIAEQVGAEIVRVANVSGRVGNRYGERAEAAVRRLEGNVVRAARQQGGRAVARGVIKSERERRQAGRAAEPSAQRAVDAANGTTGPNVA